MKPPVCGLGGSSRTLAQAVTPHTGFLGGCELTHVASGTCRAVNGPGPPSPLSPAPTCLFKVPFPDAWETGAPLERGGSLFQCDGRACPSELAGHRGCPTRPAAACSFHGGHAPARRPRSMGMPGGEAGKARLPFVLRPSGWGGGNIFLTRSLEPQE